MNATVFDATTDLEVSTASAESQDCAVEVQDVHRRFGEVAALRGVSLTIRRGEFFSLLGPSGCGKTTLLRVIAGLDDPDSGVVRIGGADAAAVRAHRRPVNTVFQSYALFPHLSVWENVAFGLRMKKVPKMEIQQRVGDVLELVAIGGLAQRRPGQLSGGQKQRVALARAIVNEPQVLLLDEPLGALDLMLRQHLQVELHALQRRLGITFIYVTHDQEEALAMSDRIAVMDAGRVEQVGCAAEIYEQPRTRFVAQFLGSCNLLEASVARRKATDVWVETPLGQLRVALNGAAPRVLGRDRLTLAIRPEKIRLGVNDRPGENCFRMEVGDYLYTGSGTQYSLARGQQRLSAWTLNSRVGDRGYRVGDEVQVEIPAGGMIVLDD